MLVLDIETKTGDVVNPETDELRFIGFYEYETDSYYFYDYTQKDEINSLIRKHKVVITYNGIFYDIPILQRYGLWSKGHIHIDLFDVMMKRADFVGGRSNERYSLNQVAKILKVSNKKLEFDYDLLKKDSWSKEELELIEKYTLNDIVVTKQIFDKLEEFFLPLKDYLSKYDKLSFKWLTSTISVYTYKVICYKAGLKEEYEDAEHQRYKGGDVAEPTTSEAHENIWLWDFGSLYPHVNMQGNLFSWKCNCCSDDEKWKGNKIFPIKGRYCTKKQGKVEKVIKELYIERQKFKKIGDRREYALKIVLNSLYGITGNPVFKSLYHYETASDCTMIGRHTIRFARKKFEENGYKFLYGDTDSVFIQDNFNDKDRMLKVKNEIIVEIKKNLIFPSETFDMGVDAEIEHIWFFKSGNKFKKKHYLFVDTDKEITIKGLPMIKRDGSKIGLKIFNNKMKEQVKEGVISFDYLQVRDWLFEELENDIGQAARFFKVKKTDFYKNNSQLQAQISKKYGAGIHRLIPNKYFGIGKSTKYCSIEEFRSKNLSPHAVVLNKFWNEMEPFLNYSPKNWKPKSKDVDQIELTAWTNIK